MRKLVLLAVLLTLAACTNDDPVTPSSEEPTLTREQVVTELRKRPDMDKAYAAYDQALTDIRTSLQSGGYVTSWKESDPGTTSDCGGLLPNVNGLNVEMRESPNWVGSAITDDKWAAALDVVTERVAQEGFKDASPVRDEAGQHVVYIPGPYGARLTFGSEVQTLLGLRTGCHPRTGVPLDPTPSVS